MFGKSVHNPNTPPSQRKPNQPPSWKFQLGPPQHINHWNQMTEKLNSKLRKFLSKPRLTPIGDRISQPVILTDSKGQINRHVTGYLVPPAPSMRTRTWSTTQHIRKQQTLYVIMKNCGKIMIRTSSGKHPIYRTRVASFGNHAKYRTRTS